MGWLDHKQLQIIKGIGKTPTDSLSAEPDLVTFNLMSGIVSLDSSGWSPAVAAVKSSGVWADSPISDGRTLLATPVGNVTEKMSIIIKDTTAKGVQKQLSNLNMMVNACRSFWQDYDQTDPVYLMWYASCGVGPQYAALYNIETVTDYLDTPTPSIRVTMTLEREPYWRGLPPGANPKLWSFYVNGQQIGTNKTLSDGQLISGSDHLIVATVNNKFEWSPTAAGLQTTPLSKNYIDITASQVPGDAPALTEMAIFTGVTAADIYIGRTTIPRSSIGHDGLTHHAALILNVGDNFVGTLAITAGTSADAVLSNGSSVTYYYGKRTSTGIDANYVTSAGWGSGVGGGLILPDRELYKGSYAVFVRAANQSAAATLTDMKMRLTIQEDEANPATQYTNKVIFDPVNPPLSSVQGQWPLVYMGVITLPLSNRNVQSISSGYGRQIQQVVSNLSFLLEQKVDVATANRIFVAVDVILMPLEGGLSQIISGTNISASSTTIVTDNTGYLSKGRGASSVGYANTNGGLKGGVSMEMRGQDITLTPNTAQRLYFINDSHPSSGLDPQSLVNSDMTVRLNIIPRWTGIRDV